jgi:hypothetical protein
MEEFIEYIKILINTMGFKVFEPLIKDTGSVLQSKEYLYVKGAHGANGKGNRTSDGFIVFASSELAANTVPSFSKSFNVLRDELLKNDIIKNNGTTLIFASDYLFSSPSIAAAVIMGRNANGLTEWKDSSGKELKSIEQQEISKANKAANA